MRKILFLMFLLTLGVCLFSACQSNNTAPVTTKAFTTTEVPVTTAPVTVPQTTEAAPAVLEKITPERAKAMMEEGGVIVVDVRREDEYASGHIPGALLVPNETITETAPTQLPDKNAVLLIYCRSGRRSAEAAQKLSDMGYRQVYDFGGILDWPYETTTE